jgi:RNA polymerase sigma-70 factor (ECF subfamily)
LTAARFTDLYTEHYGRVVAYAKRRVGDLAAAEDIAAEVFRIAWQRTGEIGVPGAGWLFETARHTVLHHVRTAARQGALAESAAREAGRRQTLQADEDAQVERVRQALEELTPDQRELLTAHYLDGLSGAECGALLGCSTGAVWVRLHRARAALKQRFDDLGAQTSPATAKDVR